MDEDELSDTFYTEITRRLKPRNFTVGGREVEGICAKTHVALKKKRTNKNSSKVAKANTSGSQLRFALLDF